MKEEAEAIFCIQCPKESLFPSLLHLGLRHIPKDHYYKIRKHVGCGGSRLKSQRLGVRGRQMSEFETSLIYTVSSRDRHSDTLRPCLKKNKTNKKQNRVHKAAWWSASTICMPLAKC